MLPRGVDLPGVPLPIAWVCGAEVTCGPALACAGATGAFSWANTARAAARAASACWGVRTPCVGRGVWVPERAWRSEELGGICMIGKICHRFA